MTPRFRLGFDSDGWQYVWDREVQPESFRCDSEVQPKSFRYCLLWEVRKKQYGIYKKAELHFKTIEDSFLRDSVLEAYTNWYKENTDIGRKSQEELIAIEQRQQQELRAIEQREQVEKREQELRAIEERRIASLTVEERLAERRKILGELHKKNLEDLGVPYEGVRLAGEVKFHRIAHCWKCKKPLDNSVDIECNGCGWIICDCGACGCRM